MEKLTAVLIVTVMVMSGINSVTLLVATVGNSGSVPENFTITLDLKELPLDSDMVFTPEQEVGDNKGTYREKPISQTVTVNPRKSTDWVISSLFSANSYFVVGEEAYTTDILGTSHISYGLALGGAFENPQGRTDTILTREERDQGNLIIVGGPSVNPAATEFGGYCGISYDKNHNVSFTIRCEGRSIYLDLEKYPYEDTCIIYLAKFNTRNVLLVWGYGWRGTYAGSLFLEDPSNWEAYRNAHLLLLRWKDTNRDGFVQLEEVTVEQCA